MTFDFPGYELKFVQRCRCTDETAHLCTYIYKFHSPVTHYHYIVRAEQHEHDVFAIKFYCKKDRKSEYKYSKIVNKGDLGNIIMSCAKLIPVLLKAFPAASFSFAASRSVDTQSLSVEDLGKTQRYRLYSYMIPLKFGHRTFKHIAYDAISCYLLYNKRSAASLDEIEDMFKRTYTNLGDLNL